MGATNQRGQHFDPRLVRQPQQLATYLSSTSKGNYCSKVVRSTLGTDAVDTVINNQTMPSLGEDLTIAQLAAIGVETLNRRARVGEGTYGRVGGPKQQQRLTTLRVQPAREIDDV